MTARGSKRHVMWRCSRCGNVWAAAPKDRTHDKTMCPKCSAAANTKGAEQSIRKVVINGIEKKSTELDLDELKQLFSEYRDQNENHLFPTQIICNSAGVNLPTGGTVKKILKRYDMTWRKFLTELGQPAEHMQSARKDVVVNGKKMSSYSLDISDLVILFLEYRNKNGHLPTKHDCNMAGKNLPTAAALDYVLQEEGVAYREFIRDLGKRKNTSLMDVGKNYDVYIQRFKDVCAEIGHVPTVEELTSNPWGLPGPIQFYKYNPDPSVNTYSRFVEWCGLKANVISRSEDEVTEALLRLAGELNHPLGMKDIKQHADKLGFSYDRVVNLFGGITFFKKKYGLPRTISPKRKSYEECRENMDKIMADLSAAGRKRVSWDDFRQNRYGIAIDHRVYSDAFKRVGQDIHIYVQNHGFMFKAPSGGEYYYYPDGEKVCSRYEDMFTAFLRQELGMRFNEDYRREVLYDDFLPKGHDHFGSRMNCDYLFELGTKLCAVEIAGYIENHDGNWRTWLYETKTKRDYQKRLIVKEQMLTESGIRFLFVFPEEMKDGSYKLLTKEFLHIHSDAVQCI